MRRPGDLIAVGLVLEALAIDWVLLRYQHETISTCVRRSFAAKCVVAYLAAHLILELPHDPLSRLDRWARKAVADGPVPE